VAHGPGSATAATAGTGSRDEARLVDLDVPRVATATGDRGTAHARRTTPSGSVVARLARTTTRHFGLVGVTWEPGFPDRALTVQVRTHDRGGWSAWQTLEAHEPDQPAEPGSRDGTMPEWVGDANGVSVRVLSATGAAPEDVRVAVIDGGTGLETGGPAATTTVSPAVATATTAAATRTVATPTTSTATTSTATTTTGVAPMPRIITREEWGVDESTETTCSEPVYASTMKGIVLHHTAGSNDYTEEEAPGIVRGIHAYHTQARGWCDIGYNFLVDRYGNIYEGRRGGIERQVRGAHAGTWAVNLYTTGISMMGDFETADLTPELKRSVVRLSAWRLSYFGHGAYGKIHFGDQTLKRISGHRDVYLSGIRPATATACPGAYAYDWLENGLRRRVQRRIDAYATPAPTTTRVAGENRYATAAAIAGQSFPATGGAVFLASGESFPDALSGGPAAASQTAPTLLVRDDALPQDTADQLARLQPSRIYVLGGEGAVSAEVADAAAQYGGTVTRLAGSNRYGTGVAVAKSFWATADVVYLASGEDYPDALSGGALAAHDGAPILLAHDDKVSASVLDELTALNPSRVVLLGGTGALGEEVAAQVGQALPAAAVSRLAGADRYETSAAVARAGWGSTDDAYLASGADFPDALAGVPAAAAHDAPLLLSRAECLPPAVYDEMTALAPPTRVLLGGTAVRYDGVLDSECTAA
jgi:putative cell wall-binding protein